MHIYVYMYMHVSGVPTCTYYTISSTVGSSYSKLLSYGVVIMKL